MREPCKLAYNRCKRVSAGNQPTIPVRQKAIAPIFIFFARLLTYANAAGFQSSKAATALEFRRARSIHGVKPRRSQPRWMSKYSPKMDAIDRRLKKLSPRHGITFVERNLSVDAAARRARSTGLSWCPGNPRPRANGLRLQGTGAEQTPGNPLIALAGPGAGSLMRSRSSDSDGPSNGRASRTSRSRWRILRPPLPSRAAVRNSNPPVPTRRP